MKIKIKKNIYFGYRTRPLIIAEISGNHGGSKKKFLNLIIQAAKNGADLVKIQTYEPDDITIKNINFKIRKGIWSGSKLWNLYQRACTPYDWHDEAFDIAKKNKIELFSTPFSLKALSFLESRKVNLYKISSFEITDLKLINEIAKTKKPIIISTGLCSIKEIQKSLNVINKYHNKVIIMHCVSNYPTQLIDTNLKRIIELKNIFKKNLIGLSDHTNGIISSICATTLGIVAIEKHLKLTPDEKTDDAQFSILPKDLQELKKITKDIFISRFNSKKIVLNKDNIIFRRSIFTNKALRKNTKLKESDLITYRPKIGIDASFFYKIINKKLNKNLKKNDPIFWKDIKK